MNIDVKQSGRSAVIKLSGRLDMNTSPDIRKTALALFTQQGCKYLNIDFTNVSYIDTSGLAILVEILLAATEHRAQLTLTGLQDRVQYLLDVNGLTGFFKIESLAGEKLIA